MTDNANVYLLCYIFWQFCQVFHNAVKFFVRLVYKLHIMR